MTLQLHAGTVRRFSRLMKFSAWLQNLPNKLTPPPFRLLQVGMAFWQSRVLYAAARLDIATALADETLDADDIAHRVSADPDAVYRMLRMLAALGIFEETNPRQFRNNQTSDFLREDNPRNARAMVLMHNSDTMSRPWYEQFEQGVRSGESPFQLTHGEELFTYMDNHAEFDALFARAMDSVETLVGDSFAQDFDWSRFDRVIDVGGSRGTKALMILKQHPALRALVVDRAQVIREARSFRAATEDPGLLERVDFEVGDVLKAVPVSGNDKDIYLLSAVLHGFDDETCIRALRNVADAARAGRACIAVLELVPPEKDIDLATASFDLQMFVNTRGRERTLAEWQAVFRKSALILGEVVQLRSFGKILVLRPGEKLGS